MYVFTPIKSSVKNLLDVDKSVFEHNKLHSESVALKRNQQFVPPGHFYSPLPSVEEILRDESKIFGPVSKDILGVDLRESDQLRLLEEFIPFYSEMPFQPQKTEGLRYYFENPAYSYSDAILLHCIIRYLRPKRIIEVVMMNTYIEYFHESFFLGNMPACLKNPGGSIWIRKVSK